MFGIIVLLENDFFRLQTVIFEGSHELLTQDFLVEMLIHSAINLTHESNSTSSHTTPNHYGSSTMLECLFDLRRLYALPLTDPAPGTAIRTKSVGFGLI